MHAEAIITGTLAGYNAVRHGLGLKPVELPVALAVGDIIAHENKMKATKDGLRNRYTFAGASYFARMKELGLYSIDIGEIEKRVELVKMKGFFEEKLV